MQQKKQLALICQHFYPEMLSTGLFMTHIATGLVQKGWAVRVYCAKPSYQPDQENSNADPLPTEHHGVEIIRVPTFGAARNSPPYRILNALTFLLGITCHLLRDHKKLLGILNTTNPPFLGIIAWLAKSCLGIPYLTIVHDVYPDVAVRLGVLSQNSPITWLWNRITQLILNQSTGLIVIGRDMAQLIRSKLKCPTDTSMALIPHWADPAMLYPVSKDENNFVNEHGLTDHFVIQYSGRLGRVHNLAPLIEAAQQLQDTPALFQFIGEGAKKAELEAKVQQMGLTNVQFLPYQPYEALATSISAADLAVVALQENCNGVSVPSKTYGILACARPVLALMSLESEIGQMVGETDCGVVLENSTGDSIAQKVRSLMDHPDLLNQMGTNAYRAFERNYTLDKALERYDSFIRECFDKFDDV